MTILMVTLAVHLGYMNKYLYFFAFLILGSCKNNNQDQKHMIDASEFMTSIESTNYPSTFRDSSVIDDYGKEKINDPYRWLEDDNAPETIEWVKQQNKVTGEYLERIPFRQKIEERLSELWDYEKLSAPFKEGDAYYFFKNDGLQNQSVMFSSKELDGESEVFFDPNKLSEDGTTSLGGFSFNKEGNLMAYQISEGGSDWRTIKIKDVATGNDLSDEVDWVKFSGMSWSENGFFYSRYPAYDEDGKLSAKNEYHSVYFHKIGTSQKEDKLIYVDNDFPQRNAYVGTSDDGNYYYVAASESTSGNSLMIGDAKTMASKKVVDSFENDFNFIHNNGSQMLFLTNEGAPKNRLIAIDYNDPSKSNWKNIIPESEDALRSISVVGNRLFANYLHNASSLIKVFEMDGSFVADLELPGIGTTRGVSGKPDGQIGFFSFTSFTQPSTIYKLNPNSLQSELYKAPELDIDLSQFVTKQVWYSSKDGTKVPMFITHKKGLVMDGNRPTLLYGYGGFDIPITPGFSIKRLPLMEYDGIYAVANIRGGGEFGSEWHKAGTKERKQNVFDDFQAAAEYLIAEDYTNSKKLAIEGRSNGGLLVGACMTQRPDLYAVAFPGVGVLDMLRYHKFTIGWAWAGDYGRSDDPEAFDYLKAYSPLHNLKEVDYPATMVTTADHDDRVVPAHSFKFISELQHKHKGKEPVLIRVETSAGHGAGKPTSKQIEEAADELSFMFFNFGENPYLNN